uniref:Uncharacterized protein n=1 Tax=Lepeophtheirus salmonis TaxID=72036 RepID=A0A0K2VAQ7_LEPSM
MYLGLSASYLLFLLLHLSSRSWIYASSFFSFFVFFPYNNI